MGDWRALAVCVQLPTGVGSYKQPPMPFAFVGAHPVGDFPISNPGFFG